LIKNRFSSDKASEMLLRAKEQVRNNTSIELAESDSNSPQVVNLPGAIKIDNDKVEMFGCLVFSHEYNVRTRNFKSPNCR